MQAASSAKPRVAVIGAGASGILALIKLKEAGYDDIVAFEKAGSLGGTWRDNRYPGLTCDVPSLAYRYSFAPNAEWSRVCAPGWEILDYLNAVAERFDVKRHMQFGHEIVRAERKDGRWHLTSDKGEQGAFDVVLTATGVLHHPIMPNIPGLGTFAGQAFHTARWPEGLDLRGKRVGLIGTGSTATQITGAIVGDVEKLSLFQRTAQWILPLLNPQIPEEDKARFRADPALLESEYDRLNDEQGTRFAAALVGANDKVYDTVSWMCRKNLEDSVRDPELKAKLTPNYRVGCKRLIMADGFYEALQQPNADLVTTAIAGIEPGGVRTSDGTLHELDVLILATGFDTHRFFRPMEIVNHTGLTIAEAWSEKNAGYLGVATPDFPNWFMIGGPNSPIGNFSWLMTAETQLGYVLQLIGAVDGHGRAGIAPKRSVTDAFNQAMDNELHGTVWASGCKSWYLDAKGRVASWPWTYEKFLADLSVPNLDEFDIVAA